MELWSHNLTAWLQHINDQRVGGGGGGGIFIYKRRMPVECYQASLTYTDQYFGTMQTSVTIINILPTSKSHFFIFIFFLLTNYKKQAVGG